MLSSILHSKRAILVNIQIMRTFVRMRNLVADNTDLRKAIEHIEKRLDVHDRQIQVSFAAMKSILQPGPKPGPHRNYCRRSIRREKRRKWDSGRRAERDRLEGTSLTKTGNPITHKKVLRIIRTLCLFNYDSSRRYSYGKNIKTCRTRVQGRCE
jgi:hypothetical protein